MAMGKRPIGASMTIKNLECPDCGGPMVSRKNKSTGQRFWGCASFPECRGTRDTNGMSSDDKRLDQIEYPDDEWRGRND